MMKRLLHALIAISLALTAATPLVVSAQKNLPLMGAGGGSGGGGGPTGEYTNQLSAYYSMDEASGTLIDVHSARDGAETSGTIAAATGIVSGGRQFAATDTEYAAVTDHADLNFNTGTWSIQFWVNLQSVVTGYILSKQKPSSPYNGYGILISNRQLSIQMSDGTFGQIDSSTTALPPIDGNTWAHVVITRNGTNYIYYINTTSNSGTGRGGDLDFAQDLLLGTFTGLANYADAILDEVGIWKGLELTSSQVVWLYNSGAGRDYTTLAAQ